MDEHRCIFAQKEKNIWSIFNNWSLLWSRSKWIQGVSCVYRHNSSWTNMCIFKLLCEAFVMFHTLSQLSYTVHVISFSNDSFTHHFLFIYFHMFFSPRQLIFMCYLFTWSFSHSFIFTRIFLQLGRLISYLIFFPLDESFIYMGLFFLMRFFLQIINLF